MTAAILAGGLGTRLRAAVADRPKVLAEIRGRPFLSYLIEQLAVAGVRRAVLCTGYMGEAVRAAFGGSHRGVELGYSQEPAPLGTGGALRLAAGLLDTRTVLALNGDSYCAADLAAFEADHRAHDSRATLALVRVDDAGRFGQVELDPSHRILRFEEKGARSGPGWINAGLYLVDRGWIEEIPAGRAVSLEREVFPGWIGRGLRGWPGDGPFLDIGTPESYREADRFFAAREAR